MTDERWDADDWAVLILLWPTWVIPLGLMMWGLVVAGKHLAPAVYRSVVVPVRHVITVYLLPYWFDYLVWLVVGVGLVWLGIAIKEELTPPARRLRIRRHWWWRGIGEQRRYRSARKDLDEAFRAALDNVKKAQNRAQ